MLTMWQLTVSTHYNGYWARLGASMYHFSVQQGEFFKHSQLPVHYIPHKTTLEGVLIYSMY